jgi:hypothetical protein
MVSLPHEEKGLLVEVATVGHEGMVGPPLLLGGDKIPGECFCQVPGQATRIRARKFKQLVDELPSFRKVLLRYTRASRAIGCSVEVIRIAPRAFAPAVAPARPFPANIVANSAAAPCPTY